MAQLEYGRGSNNLTFGNEPVSAFILFAWGVDALYIQIKTSLRNTISLALDTDLPGDFNDPTLNGDDFTFQIATPADNCASQATQITFQHPAGGIQGQIPAGFRSAGKYYAVRLEIPELALKNVPYQCW